MRTKTQSARLEVEGFGIAQVPPAAQHGVPSRLRRDLVFWLLAALTLVLQAYLVRYQSLPYQVSWVYLDEGYRLYPPVRLKHRSISLRANA